MRKFLSIFLCISLLVSTFDIIDVDDITLANTPVFTNADLSSNQADDSIDEYEYHYTGSLVFNLPIANPYRTVFTKKQTEIPPLTVNTKYNKYTCNLYRPPMA